MGKQNLKNTNQTDHKRLVISIIKVSFLLGIIIGIPLMLVLWTDILTRWKDLDALVALLQAYHHVSIPVYIGLQLLQIVVSVLPGQVFQLAAGYVFGFFPALLYAVVGSILGSSLAFALAKYLGRDFLHIFFGEEKITDYVRRLNSKRGYALVFLLYLIPGIPKDVVAYAAGASEVRFKAFITLSTIGRIPGMIGCLLAGSLLEAHRFTLAIAVGVVAVAAFVVCFFLREKLLALLDRFYESITR